MKKLLFVVLAVFLMSNVSQASHMLGGEVSWVCLGNGKYVFKFDVYRDCAGVGFTFDNQTLDVIGTPRPGNGTGGQWTQITVKPDSNRWNNANQGDITPRCQNPNGLSYSCSNGDAGAVQWFPFQSDPITLTGTPPTSGWEFRWRSPCCRPGVQNLAGASGKNMALRAFMYPILDPNAAGTTFLNVNPCVDSSPEFAERPTNQICRGYEFTYNHNARDNELDSLVYTFDDPVDGNGGNIGYSAGFSRTNPFPDQNFNSQNIPATLNSKTGEMKQANYSGSGALSYVVLVRVDAWRCGRVIASIFREMPFVFFDCAPLPGGKINNPPQILIDGQSITNYDLEVFAGEKVEIGFQSVDNDLNPTFSPPFQKNTLEPTGFLFSKNFANDQFCETPLVAPCATLTPPPVQTPGNPYQLTQLSGVATEFKWQTDCNHISVAAGGQCGAGTGVVGAAEGIFNFVMKTYDDNCPLRSINYPTISVKVKEPTPLIQPIVKGASMELNGQTTINWVPPIDSANTFEEYDIQGATVGQNLSPNASFLNVQTGVKTYKQDRTFSYIQFPTSILAPFPSPRDYYLRMQTYSGCTGDVPSGWSEPTRVIELEATPTNAARTNVNLSWNRPKPANAATNPAFVYESPTRFYIHENVFKDNNDTLIDLAKWTIVGSTSNTTFSKGSPACNDRVAYRIEARDTVVTYEQGSRIDIPNPKFDTLVFSTFSMVDSVLLKAPGTISPPVLDSLVVLANGDVFFKIDLAATPIAGKYKIYELGSTVPLTTISAPNSTYTHQGANALQGNAMKQYQVEAIHLCQPNKKASDTVAVRKPTALVVSAGTSNPCDEVLTVTWDEPIGLIANNITYKVFQSLDGGPFLQIAGGLNNRTFTLPSFAGDKDYEFYIVAENADGDVFISETHLISIPNKPSKEAISPPNVRCVAVQENGDVRVEWTPFGDDYDTTNIWRGYTFKYRPAGTGAFTSITVPPGMDKEDTAFVMSDGGLNAQNMQYDIEVGVLKDGCRAIVDTTAEYQTIFLTATRDTSNFGDLVWNSAGIASLNDYKLFKDLSDDTKYNKGAEFAYSSSEGFIDIDNSSACDDTLFYYTSIDDDLLGCYSRSNIDTAVFFDRTPPPPQLIDYVTVLEDGRLRIYWSDPSAPDVDSLYFSEKPTGPGRNDLGRADFFTFGKRFTVDTNLLDPRLGPVSVLAQPIDGCRNLNTNTNSFDFHTSMYPNVTWNACDSAINVSWNAYEWYNTGDGVKYNVIFNPIGFGLGSTEYIIGTTDTTGSQKVGDDWVIGPDGLEVEVYVRAEPTGPGANSDHKSRSTRIRIVISFASTPNYTYAHYTNVLSDNEVELQVYPDKDEAIFNNIGQFVVYRGIYPTELNPIGSVPKVDVIDSTFRFYDYTAQTNDLSYFYKVVVENTCGNAVDTSNYGRTIHLKVEADNEALTNTLRFNEYEGWDSTVAYYNVYRSMNGGGLELYEVIPPAETGSENLFVDDVYGEITAIGDFCYMVEAVQGPVTDDFQISDKLDPAISRSNEVCVVQEPLFYIPNAFSPKGVNRVFGPQGQFVNWAFYEMIIYNRWGELVFQTNDPTKGWDGKVNGKDPQIGSYVYTIRFIDADGKERKRKGSVSIIQ